MSLEDFGWNQMWEDRLSQYHLDQGIPARIISEHRSEYRLHTGSTEISARAAGKLYHELLNTTDLPAVGDWVIVDHSDSDGNSSIRCVLPRQSMFSRKASIKSTTEQVIATNIDTIWIISTFGSELNPERIERYITLVMENGAEPVLVMTKSDLADSVESVLESLKTRLPNIAIHAVSPKIGMGLDALRTYLRMGRTVALLGSSGVGKSTLINYFLGSDVLQTASVREKDGKGRHTTTHRELFLLPSGGLLLDTPGMRELQLWGVDETLEKSFADIDDLAFECRFSDCSHGIEPGCAVNEAISAGELSIERLNNYKKLKQEFFYLDARKYGRTDSLSREQWKVKSREEKQKRSDKTKL
jgi:ribosome biogenesis GTPase / thiamine phosphate phosphatase